MPYALLSRTSSYDNAIPFNTWNSFQAAGGQASTEDDAYGTQALASWRGSPVTPHSHGLLAFKGSSSSLPPHVRAPLLICLVAFAFTLFPVALYGIPDHVKAACSKMCLHA